MPSPIGSVDHLVAIIQGQLSARVENKPAKWHIGAERKARSSVGNAPQSLEALIAQRVNSIAADDPKRGRKAFRVFLESILLSHFGEHLINDPKFYELVDDVQNGMEADSDLNHLIQTAIAHLLSNVSSRVT